MEEVVKSVALVHQPWSAVPPSPSDPIGQMIDRTARGLAERCRVTCFATQHPSQLQEQPLPGLVSGTGEIRRVSAPLDRLLMPAKLLDRLTPSRPFNSTNLYRLGYVLKVSQSLRDRACDVVHVHTFPQWAPVLRRMNPNCAIVVHMHDNWLTRLDPQRVRRRLRDADAVLAVSEHVAEKIRLTFPDFAGIVHATYGGIDEMFFNVEHEPPAGDTRRLLYAGLIAREKGVAILLDAMDRVLEKFPSATLALVGSEAEEGFINHLRAGMSVGARRAVVFKGELGGRALAEQYAQADVFVAPTIGEEPLGVPLIRAMAAGVAPVASRVGAFPELIETGKTGRLVTPGDAADLAAAILLLLQDDDARATIAENARQFAKDKFSWSGVPDGLLALYGKAIAHRRDVSKLNGSKRKK